MAFLFLVVSMGGCTSTSRPPKQEGWRWDKPSPLHAKPHPHYKVGKPYTVQGKKYYPQESFTYKEEGVASWYGPGFHGRLTANGEVFDSNKATAAHRTLQMPSIARVTNLANNKAIFVRINDRGPYCNDRLIDLSKRAAQELGFLRQGTARVRVEVMTDISQKLAELARKGQFPDYLPGDPPVVESGVAHPFIKLARKPNHIREMVIFVDSSGDFLGARYGGATPGIGAEQFYSLEIYDVPPSLTNRQTSMPTQTQDPMAFQKAIERALESSSELAKVPHVSYPRSDGNLNDGHLPALSVGPFDSPDAAQAVSKIIERTVRDWQKNCKIIAHKLEAQDVKTQNVETQDNGALRGTISGTINHKKALPMHNDGISFSQSVGPSSNGRGPSGVVGPAALPEKKVPLYPKIRRRPAVLNS